MALRFPYIPTFKKLNVQIAECPFRQSSSQLWILASDSITSACR